MIVDYGEISITYACNLLEKLVHLDASLYQCYNV